MGRGGERTTTPQHRHGGRNTSSPAPPSSDKKDESSSPTTTGGLHRVKSWLEVAGLKVSTSQGDFSSVFTPSPRLLHYDDLPDWAKDNHHIKTGYRPIKGCHHHVASSLFYLHNETSNIYTHGLPFLLAWVQALYSLFVHLPSMHASLVDTLAFLPIQLGTLITYFCSATFHLYLCHSPEHFSMWSKLDYAGIVAGFGGGFFTLTWFLFYHHPMMKWVSITSNALCCFITVVVMMKDRFATPDYRTFRAIVFSSLFITLCVPTYVAFTRPCPDPAAQTDVMSPYLKTFMFLAIGASLFAFRIPERFIPYIFDLFGHSHCLLHILVILAINSFHEACYRAFEYRHILSS